MQEKLLSLGIRGGLEPKCALRQRSKFADGITYG